MRGYRVRIVSVTYRSSVRSSVQRSLMAGRGPVEVRPRTNGAPDDVNAKREALDNAAEGLADFIKKAAELFSMSALERQLQASNEASGFHARFAKTMGELNANEGVLVVLRCNARRTGDGIYRSNPRLVMGGRATSAQLALSWWKAEDKLYELPPRGAWLEEVFYWATGYASLSEVAEDRAEDVCYMSEELYERLRRKPGRNPARILDPIRPRPTTASALFDQ